MTRLAWLALGAVGGAIMTTLTLTVVYFFVASPLRRLERASGLELPPAVRLVWERDQRDQFLGQGFTLRAFSAPADAASAWAADCPDSYTAKRLDASEIWSKLREQDLAAASPACVKKSESTNHEEIVVIASGQIFHMAIDR
jgi:hypothetical protein